MNFVTVDLTEDVQFDRAKFLAVVHYVCANISQRELGKVKLHRILYLSDMVHYVATGRPLTGAEYRKQPFGPGAHQLASALDSLAKAGALRVTQRDYFGFPKIDYVPLQPPDPQSLTDEERRLVGDVIDCVCGRVMNEISELTHDAAWGSLPITERIPYFSAFMLQPVEMTDDDVAWGEAEARRIIAERDGSAS